MFGFLGGKRDKYVDYSKEVSGELNDKSFTWDFAFMFNMGRQAQEDAEKKVEEETEEQQQILTHDWRSVFKTKIQYYVSKLREAGLQTLIYRSENHDDELYMLVGASEKRLNREAARRQYDLSLNVDVAINKGLDVGMYLAQATISTDPADSHITMSHWHNLYGRFQNSEALNDLYRRYNNEGPNHNNSLFRTVDRIKLTYSIFVSEEALGGAGLTIAKDMQSRKHPLFACYPLHQTQIQDELTKGWFNWKTFINLPLDKIREYYGENIALYYAYLGFYCLWLIPLALIGGIFAVYQYEVGRTEVPGLWLFGFVVAAWAGLYLDSWKRKSSEFRVIWGQELFKEKEVTRPEYQGEWFRSPVNGYYEETYPWYRRLLRIAASQSVIMTLIVLVIGVVIGVFFLRKVLSEKDERWGGYITAVINAIQIVALNYFYNWLAFKLTAFENHRTQSQFENALIIKFFLFKFINSYNSLFYIAYIKKYDTGCMEDDCLFELAIQLAIIFITAIVSSNTIELLSPYVMIWFGGRKEKNEGKGVNSISPAEEQRKLLHFDMWGTVYDFDELVTQFGYVTLFVVAFPLAPLLGLINNYFEMRIDAYKLRNFYRRPMPRGAEDIGTWFHILNVLSIIAIVNNIALVTFTTDQFGNSFGGKMWKFVVIEHILLCIKFGIAYIIPDEPEWVTQHVERQRYIVSVLIDNVSELPDPHKDLKDDDTDNYDGTNVLDGISTGWVRDRHCSSDHISSEEI